MRIKNYSLIQKEQNHDMQKNLNKRQSNTLVNLLKTNSKKTHLESSVDPAKEREREEITVWALPCRAKSRHFKFSNIAFTLFPAACSLLYDTV